MDNSKHLVRATAIWLVLSLISVVIILQLHIPPGAATTSASIQTEAAVVFAIIAAVVGLGVVSFGLYFAIVFRQRDGLLEDGPPIVANPRLQGTWLVGSILLVLFAAGYGSAELEGQVNPNLVVPAGATQAAQVAHPLVVQVIGQQWQWTYRYPQYGGLETPVLVLPAHRLVQFNVTSLDVIHGFWAYQLGVKINAQPGADNVGYVYVRHTMRFDVECSSLCGLWHGYMRDVGAQAGRVVTSSAFATWMASARRRYGPLEKDLPKYSRVYYPQPYTY